MGLGKLSLGVLPALFLCALLALSWVAAALYWLVADFPINDPFTSVWASFTFTGSLGIILQSILGLMLSCLFPSRGGKPTAIDLAALSSKRQVWTLVALAAVVLLIISKGVYLFRADNYLQFFLPQAVASLSNIAAPIGVLAAGIVAARKRMAGYALMVILLLCLFAYGTRLLAMAPLIFLLGKSLGGRRVSWAGWLAGGLASYWLLPIPLQTRSLSYHGLFPYWEYVLGGRGYAAGGNVAVQLLGNVGFTAPIAEFTTSTAGKIPVAAIFASLNPLPESLTDWDIWAPQLRAHFFIPFSMIGEFANFGPLALVTAMFSWGLIVRLCVNEAMRNKSNIGKLILISCVGLASISALYITQYNTRSVSRIITIMLLLSLFSVVHRGLNRGINAQTFSLDAGSQRRLLPDDGFEEHAPRFAPGRRAGRFE